MKATYIDGILLMVTLICGLTSIKAFAISFMIFILFSSLHLVLSKSTLKELRELIINKFIEGND